MRSVVLRIIPLLCLAGLFSCEDGPVSDENWTPEIVSVESQPSANSARLKATLSSELQAVCEYGFYYGSDKESLEKVTALPDEKSFTAELKGLEASTKYFFKAYITNGMTYIYSDMSEFTTRESYDFLSIGAEPEAERAVLTASLKNVPQNIIGAGFYYGMSEEEMSPCPGRMDSNTITLAIEGLSPETQYSFRAYLITQYGEVLSVMSSFRTLSGNVSFKAEIEVVEASASDSHAEMEAFVSGNADDVTACGFYYGTDPTRLRKSLSAISEGSFYLNVSGLTPGTRYFYKAFISNGESEKTSSLYYFDTEKDYEFVRVAVRNVEGTYIMEAELSQVPDEGMAYGFMYGVNALQTISCAATLEGSTIRAEVTGLPYDTEYLFRAYLSQGDSHKTSSWGMFQTMPAPSDGGQEGGSGSSGGDVGGGDAGEKPDTGGGEVDDPDPDNIVFADRFVKEMCVARFDTDGDGELSYSEAAAVTHIPAIHEYFGYHELITSFDELQYFTSLKTADFYGCSRLTSIVLPESVREVGGAGVVLAACTSLTDVTLPAGLERLTYHGFTYCHAIEHLALPTGLRHISDFAFDECKSLKEIDIPYTVDWVSESAFARCVSLEKFSGRYASSDGKFLIVAGTVVALAPHGVSRLEIPFGTVGLGSYLCDSCMELTTVVLPQSVETIGYNAFIACYNLEKFSGRYASQDGRCLIVDGAAKAFAPKGIEAYTIDCRTIDCAFSGCATIKELSFGPSVEEIHEHALFNCKDLTSVTFNSPQPPTVYPGTSLALEPGTIIHVPAASLEAYRTAPGWSAYAHRMLGF